MKIQTNVILLLSIFSGITATVAQPVYKVQPATKKYTIVGNPLIKKTKQVEALVINGEAYLEGDIYLGKANDLDQLQRTMQGMRTQAVTADDNIVTARWENGIVPFTISDDFTPEEKRVILNALNHISERTNVCFRKRTKESSYLKYKKYTVNELGFEGGSSFLGKCGFCTDGQEIKLSFVDNTVVRHETCHALGLLHEQSREDRNSTVQIVYNNIQPGFENQFDQSVFTSTDVGTYDISSIMHYFATAFGKMVNGRRQQTIKRLSNPTDTSSFGKTSVLSSGDIEAINAMYPKDPKCSPLPVGEAEKLAKGELAVGESKTITISAREIHNLTGVFIRAGEIFQFSTSSPDWKNGDKSTDCEGYEGNILDAARRHGDIKMMALVGEIFSENNTNSYTGFYFKIGCSKTWPATKTGFLICIANDNVIAYGDNSGSVSLTIKRIQ